MQKWEEKGVFVEGRNMLNIFFMNNGDLIMLC